MSEARSNQTTWWLRTWSWLERYSGWLLVAMLLFFFAVFTAAIIRKHELGRMGYDVALIHQAVWNTAHGRFLETHAYDFTNSLLGTDSFFMAAWLAPLYRLLPSVYTLYAAQIAIVALGALPLYLLAKDRLGRVPGLAAAALYLLYTPVEYGSLYEIRFRIMGMAWLAFILLFVERRRYWALLPFIVLALSCRLDTTVAVFMAGLYALLRRRPWYYGVTLMAAGLGWYLAMTQGIIPALSTRDSYMFLEHYGHLGSTPIEVLLSPFTRPLVVVQTVFQPGKIQYLLQLGAPFLFLFVFCPPALLPALPLLALNLLSTRANQFDVYHHYQGMVTPFLLAGTILTWEWLSHWEGPAWLRAWRVQALANRVRLITLFLLLAALSTNLLFRNPLPSILLGRASPRLETARALIAQIPPDAPVAASNQLAPLVPVRQDIFLVPGGDFYYAAHPEERADYVLLDLQSGRGEDEAALLEKLRADARWRVVEEKEGYVLLKREE